MASKSPAAERRSTDTEQNALPTQARQQMVSLTESAATFYKGMEAVQQVQQHAAQRSALRLQQAAEQLRQADSAGEWLSIQSTLVLSGVQEWTQYLQEMGMTMMRMQSNLVHRPGAGHERENAAVMGMDNPGTKPLSAATVAADATSTATLEMLKSWTNLMGGAMSSKDSRASH